MLKVPFRYLCLIIKKQSPFYNSQQVIQNYNEIFIDTLHILIIDYFKQEISV